MATPLLIGGSAGFARQKAETVWVVSLNDVACEMRTSFAGNHVVHPPPTGALVHQGRRAGSPHPGMAADLQENR